MAATDAKAFPKKGEAFRLHFRIDSTTTSNPITGGLTDLAAEIMRDGAAFVATTNDPVERDLTGYGWLDLTASECDCTALVVRVTVSNASSMEFAKEVCLIDSAIDFETMGDILNLLRKQVTNQQEVARGTQGTYKLYDDDGTTVLVNSSVSASDTRAMRLESTADWNP